MDILQFILLTTKKQFNCLQAFKRVAINSYVVVWGDLGFQL